MTETPNTDYQSEFSQKATERHAEVDLQIFNLLNSKDIDIPLPAPVAHVCFILLMKLLEDIEDTSTAAAYAYTAAGIIFQIMTICPETESLYGELFKIHGINIDDYKIVFGKHTFPRT